jgi:hypothetical protein
LINNNVPAIDVEWRPLIFLDAHDERSMVPVELRQGHALSAIHLPEQFQGNSAAEIVQKQRLKSSFRASGQSPLSSCTGNWASFWQYLKPPLTFWLSVLSRRFPVNPGGVRLSHSTDIFTVFLT